MIRRLRRLFCCTACSEEDDASAENTWKEQEEGDRQHCWRQEIDLEKKEEQEEDEEGGGDVLMGSSGSFDSYSYDRRFRLESSLRLRRNLGAKGRLYPLEGCSSSFRVFSPPPVLPGLDPHPQGPIQSSSGSAENAPQEEKSEKIKLDRTENFEDQDEYWRQKTYSKPNMTLISDEVEEEEDMCEYYEISGSDFDSYLESRSKDMEMSHVFLERKLKRGSVFKRRKSSPFSRATSTIRTALSSVLRHQPRSPPQYPPPPPPPPPPAEFTVSDDINVASSSSSILCRPPVHPGLDTEPQSSSAQVDHLHPVTAAAAGAEDAAEMSESGGDSTTLMEVEAAVEAVSCSVTNTQPSLNLTAAQSSPEEFTPELLSADDEEEESFRFQCSCPGLYQCSVTGLLFHMDGEGDVLYRTVPWNRRLLAQHHKQPAGPLFDIQCVQQCVRQLHLPHCEIHSTAAAPFLSVAHVTDEGVDFIRPHQVTETHLVLNISGFSAFGNVKDADAPPGPVRALVLLFYRPPAQEEPESLLKVLLLPRNVVLRDVLRYRKKLCADECYLETSPHCRLQPQQEYTLSTCPEEDWILVQPTQAEFDSDAYDDYYPSFEVTVERILKHLKLIVRDIHSSNSVWERRVRLRSAGVLKSCDQGPSSQRLLDIRSSFIDGISAPVLKSLLDKLLEKQVLSDSEKDEVSKPQSDKDRARCVIDTVRKKGHAASSEMIDFLCELDPFLCQHLGLS